MTPEQLERAIRLVGYDAMTPGERAAFDEGLAALREAQRRCHDAAVARGVSLERARIVWSGVIAFATDVILQFERTRRGGATE